MNLTCFYFKIAKKVPIFPTDPTPPVEPFDFSSDARSDTDFEECNEKSEDSSDESSDEDSDESEEEKSEPEEVINMVKTPKKGSARKAKRSVDAEFAGMNLSRGGDEESELVMGDIKYTLLEYDGLEGVESTVRFLKLEALFGNYIIKQALIDDTGMFVTLKIKHPNTLLSTKRKNLLGNRVAMDRSHKKKVDKMAQKIFDESHQYKNEGCISTWKKIPLTFRCKKAIRYQLCKAYQPEDQTMIAMGQVVFVFECVMEEHKDAWAGPQQVMLDCAAMDFVQRRNDFAQAQAAQAAADAWANRPGGGNDDDSFKSARGHTRRRTTSSTTLPSPINPLNVIP